jgi:hypothetical protein
MRRQLRPPSHHFALSSAIDRAWRRALKKNADLSHRKRNKTKRHRAKLKAKHKAVRKRRSSGHRSTYR